MLNSRSDNEKMPFTFSVVIPIFNMEDYLEEAIESIINQSIGFLEHIQIVLVNDGSTDLSGNICQKYVNEYPENIIHIEQENAGVSNARNRGLSASKGKYINFLDADDKWSNDAFEEADSFFKKHPGVKITTAKHKFFDRKTGNHPLAYKYAEDRVVDIRYDVDYPHHSYSNVFIVRDILPSTLFNPNLMFSEDFLSINKLLLENPKYGLMKKPVYYYRKRAETNSAIDSTTTSPSWYGEVIKLCYFALVEESKKQYGCVLPYIQYCLMYDLQWRIKNPIPNAPLDPTQRRQYKQLIFELLQVIEDEIITTQRQLTRPEVLEVLRLKYKCSLGELQNNLVVIKNNVYSLLPGKDSPAFLHETTAENNICFELLNFENGFAVIEGRLSTLFAEKDVELSFFANNIEYIASIKKRNDLKKEFFFNDSEFMSLGFRVSIPLEKIVKIKVSLSLKDKYIPSKFTDGKFWGLHFAFKKAYWYHKGFALTAPKENHLKIEKHVSKTWLIKREVLFEIELWLKEKNYNTIFPYRRSALLNRIFRSKRRVWLFSDRILAAGDNGEAFFEYMQNHKIPGVRNYYAISNNSPDYKRMKRIGHTLNYNSKKYKKTFLNASLILSSAADDHVISAFGKYHSAMKDLYKFEFIFLQHGVIHADLSSWLGKYRKNIRLFVASTKREADFIIDNDSSSYSSAVVKCTGMPRHDKLQEPNTKKEKLLLLMPTWRKFLVGSFDNKIGARTKFSLFKNSEYFLFYNSLINDPRLIDALKKTGYRMKFVLHPALFHESVSFEVNEYVSIEDNCSCSYTDLFQKSSLLITDYSSVAFDFAILHKPIIYTQFDQDMFFANHTYTQNYSAQQSYFDYEENGFGKVCTSIDSAVSAIIDALNRDCCLDEKYSKRIADFYQPPIHDCCIKLLNEIKHIQ